MTVIDYSNVIMGAIASQITSLTIVYSTVYSGADQWEHQSSASLAFMRGGGGGGIHRWRVNSPHKGPVTCKMFPFDDVILQSECKGWKMQLIARPWFILYFVSMGSSWWYRSYEIKAWMLNCTSSFHWEAIINPCPMINGLISKLSWKGFLRKIAS